MECDFMVVCDGIHGVAPRGVPEGGRWEGGLPFLRARTHLVKLPRCDHTTL